MAIEDSWSPQKPAKKKPKARKSPKLTPPRAARSRPPVKPPPTTPAYDRFLASMVMDYEKWHDGIGYDLDALKEFTPDQLSTITQHLIHHSPRDWRDIEALGNIDTPAAKAAIIAALKDPDPSIRQHAQDFALDQVDNKQREKLLIQALRTAVPYGGLSQAIDEAAEFHPPAVVDALFKGALERDPEAAIHFAALLYYIYGIAKEPFDWNHRPFFLRFADGPRPEREAAFRELCQKLSVDPNKYL